MKIAIVLGTRPEIIKMAPVINELKKRKVNFFIIHTNQHYTKIMDSNIFMCLGLDTAKYNLKVGSGIHGLQTGKMLTGIEKVLMDENVDMVLVHGDTNTTFSGALAAKKLHIKVGHIEAGLRSGDKRMPEEINRVLTDHISDFCFAPTEKAKENIKKEGIEDSKIFIVGNTIVDALVENIKIVDEKSKILEKLNVSSKKYILVTLHRPENVDNKDILLNILKGINKSGENKNLKIIYPMHPRTKKMITQFKIDIPKNIQVTDPVDYLDFLALQSNAKVIITDSGGIQEESCILGIPCITVRENTERPETVDIGANVISGTDPDKIVECTKTMIEKEHVWDRNIFGNGESAKQIVDIILSKDHD